MAKFNLTVEGFFWASEGKTTMVKQDLSEMLQTYVHQVNSERDGSKHILVLILQNKTVSWTQPELIQI
jgi:hypothetical protein